MTFAHDAPGTEATAWRRHPRRREVRALDPARLLAPAPAPAPGRGSVLVVVAAHPDDETLGAGALVAEAHARGVEVRVVVLTDGEASHPDSPTHTPAELAGLRREEVRAAVDVLAPGSTPWLLGLPDGAVAAHEDEVVAALVGLVGDGRDTVVVAPWRGDQHPDHEAAGRAAAAAAVRTGARLLEYPVWFWHWGRPDLAPWSDLRAVRPSPVAREAKARAMAAHRSQVAPLSAAPGDEALLSPGFLAHFTGAEELFVEAGATDEALEQVHRRDADPWGTDRRWYEQRKRSLLLAALPRASFLRGLEVGCSTGALTAELAPRCRELVALDASPAALGHARDRLALLDGVRLEAAVVPGEWPEGDFDLVVLSETGYFLSPRDLEGLVERVRACLTDDGVLVLCHWRHRVEGWVLDGPDVHRVVAAAGLGDVLGTWVDRDVEILVIGPTDLLPDPRA